MCNTACVFTFINVVMNEWCLVSSHYRLVNKSWRLHLMKSPCGHLVDVSLRSKFTLFVSVLAFNALGSLLCPFVVYTKHHVLISIHYQWPTGLGRLYSCMIRCGRHLPTNFMPLLLMYVKIFLAAYLNKLIIPWTNKEILNFFLYFQVFFYV